MPIDQNILFIAAGMVPLFLVVWIIWIEVRLKRIFRGRRAKDLESLLAHIAEDVAEIQKQLQKDRREIKVIEQEIGRSMRHVGIVRFNAFHEAGGDQSFAVTLLNDKKDGVVISSLHNRETNRVYAKPIKEASSLHHLSEEEKEAIRRALNAPNPKS
ncbi:MAG: DUF4446 family protein [bacterium]|nr:DUF4446 family protein [bacterium]